LAPSVTLHFFDFDTLNNGNGINIRIT